MTNKQPDIMPPEARRQQVDREATLKRLDEVRQRFADGLEDELIVIVRTADGHWAWFTHTEISSDLLVGGLVRVQHELLFESEDEEEGGEG